MRSIVKWEKVDRIENEEGTTIKYCTEGSIFGSKFILVESRKRHIPHANAKGPHDTWDHTSYFVTQNGQDIKEFWRLSEAKEFAEKLWEETKSPYES